MILNLVYHNFPLLYTSETKSDRKFAKLTVFWKTLVSCGKHLVSPGKIWYTFPSKFSGGGGTPNGELENGTEISGSAVQMFCRYGRFLPFCSSVSGNLPCSGAPSPLRRSQALVEPGHPDAVLLQYLASDQAKLDKLFQDPALLRTPIVRNGRQATVGYCPEIWASWS